MTPEAVAPKAPLPWPVRVAVGALSLLTFQGIQEFVVFGSGPRDAPTSGLGPASLALSCVTLTLLIGLLRRDAQAWGRAVLPPGGLGIPSLVLRWPEIRGSLRKRLKGG